LLFRSGPHQLSTPGGLNVNEDLTTNGSLILKNATKRIIFASDTSLYRNGPASLRTDGDFYVSGALTANGTLNLASNTTITISALPRFNSSGATMYVRGQDASSAIGTGGDLVLNAGTGHAGNGKGIVVSKVFC